MILPRKHHFCIWCGKGLGDGQRSKEHVIPECIGGRLQCPDVCRGCNSGFGAKGDWTLLHDPRIFQAATEAGISPDEFLGCYEAITTTNSGLQVRLRVKNGVSQVIGGLGAAHVHIGSDASGAFSSRDVAQLRAKMKSQVKAKRTDLNAQLVDREIDRMIDALFNRGPAAPVYSPLLGEGFALDSTTRALQISRTYHELDTFRAMAKSLYTVLKSVLPPMIERLMADSLVDLATFAKGETEAPNLIHHHRLSRKPTRCHRIRVEFGRNGLCFEVALYDVLAWRIQGKGRAANGRRVRLPEFTWAAVDDRFAPDVVVLP